jgi:hypothetical protein
MRKPAIVVTSLLVLALVAMMIGCCGGEVAPSPTPTATPIATAEPTPTAAATPAPTVAPTATPPPGSSQTLPCHFHGTVKLDGAVVADGTQITVEVAGDVYETDTPSVYGASTYAIKVKPVKPYVEGAKVTFSIDGHAADQMGSWTSGGNIELNLTASTAEANNG